MFACAKVRRICAGDSNKSAVNHIFTFNEAELCELIDGEVQESRHASIGVQLRTIPRYHGQVNCWSSQDLVDGTECANGSGNGEVSAV